MKKFTLLSGLLAAASLIGVPDSAAQPAGPDARITAGPPAPDPTIELFSRRIEGAYSDDRFMLNIVSLATADLPRSLYVELMRRDSPPAVAWRQVWVLSAHEGEVRMRVCEFPVGSSIGAVFTGAWATPDYFPKLSRTRLHPVGDLHVSEGEEGEFSIHSPAPLPTFRDGAMELDVEVTLQEDVLSWRMTGISVEGEPMWGEHTLKLTRLSAAPKATPRENGLLVIDFAIGEGPEAAEGDTVSVHYDAYTMGGLQFFSTRWQGQRAVSSKLPAPYVEGWSQAMTGMRAGGVRRAVVPPWLGYGSQARGNIPPDSWLIFDFELQAVLPGDPLRP